MIVTIERISEIYPHPNADRLELAKILGYQLVIPKESYTVDQIVVFVQPDSVLPKEQEWALPYLKYAEKRVKAIKLRGEWSEGIAVPIEVFGDLLVRYKVGDEVSEIIGVIHYEPPIPQELDAVGGLPFGIPKTDETRFENFRHLPYGVIGDVSLKIDGKSGSLAYHLENDSFTVIGRRFAYDMEKTNDYTNAFSETVKQRLKNYCIRHGVSLVIRGEIYGQGIQSSALNPHSKLPRGFAMFSVYNIGERRYENKGDAHYFLNVARELQLSIVPILEENVEITPELLKKYSVDLEKIQGNYFEGVVIKHEHGSFKVINKYYDANK